jgi:hypothetical protein
MTPSWEANLENELALGLMVSSRRSEPPVTEANDSCRFNVLESAIGEQV